MVEDYLSKNIANCFENESEDNKVDYVLSNISRKRSGNEYIVMSQLIEAIYMFFLNGEAVDEDEFYAQSHIFDLGISVWSISIDEVESTKKKLVQYIKEAQKVYEVEDLAFRYIQLSNFAQQKYEEILPYYKKSMKRILQEISEIDYGYWSDKVQREKSSIKALDEAFEEVVSEVNRSNVDKMIEYLSKHIYDATAMRYAHWLFPVCKNANLTDYLISKGEILIDDALIPAKSNSYVEGEVRYRLISGLYSYFPEKMDKFMDEKRIDKLARFRFDVMTAKRNVYVNGFEVEESTQNAQS